MSLETIDKKLGMTEAKHILQWSDLNARRRNLHLKFFYSIYHSQSGISREKYMKPPSYISQRQDHPLKVEELAFKSDILLYSFFDQTACAWNLLPPNVAQITSVNAFYCTLSV